MPGGMSAAGGNTCIGYNKVSYPNLKKYIRRYKQFCKRLWDSLKEEADIYNLYKLKLGFDHTKAKFENLIHDIKNLNFRNATEFYGIATIKSCLALLFVFPTLFFSNGYARGPPTIFTSDINTNSLTSQIEVPNCIKVDSLKSKEELQKVIINNIYYNYELMQKPSLTETDTVAKLSQTVELAIRSRGNKDTLEASSISLLQKTGLERGQVISWFDERENALKFEVSDASNGLIRLKAIDPYSAVQVITLKGDLKRGVALDSVEMRNGSISKEWKDWKVQIDKDAIDGSSVMRLKKEMKMQLVLNEKVEKFEFPFGNISMNYKWNREESSNYLIMYTKDTFNVLFGYETNKTDSIKIKYRELNMEDVIIVESFERWKFKDIKYPAYTHVFDFGWFFIEGTNTDGYIPVRITVYERGMRYYDERHPEELIYGDKPFWHHGRELAEMGPPIISTRAFYYMDFHSMVDSLRKRFFLCIRGPPKNGVEPKKYNSSIATLERYGLDPKDRTTTMMLLPCGNEYGGEVLGMRFVDDSINKKGKLDPNGIIHGEYTKNPSGKPSYIINVWEYGKEFTDKNNFRVVAGDTVYIYDMDPRNMIHYYNLTVSYGDYRLDSGPTSVFERREVKEKMRATPNPAQEQIYIDIGDVADEPRKIYLSTPLGMRVGEAEIPTGERGITLDLSDYPQGVIWVSDREKGVPFMIIR